MARHVSRMQTLQRLLRELGLATIIRAPRDLHIVFATRFLRMIGYGAGALVLALYLAALGISDGHIGLFMTITLLGDVGISLLLTLAADHLGRRRILLLGCLCMVLSGSVFAVFSNYWALLPAAVVGVVSPSGSEIGPFRAVEDSVLAQLVHEDVRSDAFAWYVVIGTLGSAVGLAGGGWLVEGRDEVDAYKSVFWLYAGVGVLEALLTLALSPDCEIRPAKTKLDGDGNSREHGEEQRERLLEDDDDDDAVVEHNPKTRTGFLQLSSKARHDILRLCVLSGIDSLASGMTSYSLVNFFMDRKFHVSKALLGTIMSLTWFCSSIGNVFSSALCKRIGPIRTMAFTHLPSVVFLALMPAPGSLWPTVVLLVCRGSLASMDQAPRSAFLSAMFAPDERTAVMGIVNVGKTPSQSAGPSITGVLAGRDRFWTAFVVAGALKVSYGLGLLAVFVVADDRARRKARRRVEEQSGAGRAGVVRLEEQSGAGRSAGRNRLERR